MTAMKTVTVVVSVYNEEQALPQFVEAVKTVLDQAVWDYAVSYTHLYRAYD